MKKNTQAPSERGRRFYRIIPNDDGTVDIWLTPGEAVPSTDEITGVTDYNIRVMAVRGINPKDPQWGGDLEGHIRKNYYKWIESAEEVEL